MLARSFSERRKSGRYLPINEEGFALYVNGKKVENEKLIDIGPDGFKIFHQKFSTFHKTTNHRVELRKGDKVLFYSSAEVSWRVNLRFPLNTCLIGFKFSDRDNSVAKFWVGKGYLRGFRQVQENNYRRFKTFHNLVMGEGARAKLGHAISTFGIPIIAVAGFAAFFLV